MRPHRRPSKPCGRTSNDHQIGKVDRHQLQFRRQIEAAEDLEHADQRSAATSAPLMLPNAQARRRRTPSARTARRRSDRPDTRASAAHRPRPRRPAPIPNARPLIRCTSIPIRRCGNAIFGDRAHRAPSLGVFDEREQQRVRISAAAPLKRRWPADTASPAKRIVPANGGLGTERKSLENTACARPCISTKSRRCRRRSPRAAPPRVGARTPGTR